MVYNIAQLSYIALLIQLIVLFAAFCFVPGFTLTTGAVLTFLGTLVFGVFVASITK